MPRTLAIDPRVPTSHGLIIRRHTLAEQIRAHISISEARAYARRIVKQAQLHAEAIKLEAMQQGFDDGWQDSLNVLYQALRGTENLHGQIERTLKQVVRETMEKALVQPDLELKLLEGWLAAAPQAPSQLTLVLPRRAQEQVPHIVRRIEEALNITPTVSLSDNDGIVIECGDQIIEFAPSRVLQETDDLAKSSVRRLEVKKQCAAWSKHVVQLWLSNLAMRHEGELQHGVVEGMSEGDDLLDDDDDDDDIFDDDMLDDEEDDE